VKRDETAGWSSLVVVASEIVLHAFIHHCFWNVSGFFFLEFFPVMVWDEVPRMVL
jgi:hypothetical protein